MGEENKKIDELIAKHLFDKLSAEEEKVLANMVKNDPANRKLLDKSKDLSGLLEGFGSELNPDENVAWHNLVEKIETESQDKSNDAKIQLMPWLNVENKTYVIRVAAVILVLFGIYFSFKNISDTNTEYTDESYMLADKISDHRVELSTSKAVDAVYLPDNSLVYLNTNTKLIYDEGFSLGKRIVYLEGEAFFKVSHDPQKPFIVYTRKVKTEVLGTSFNIKANKGSEITEVSVYSGKVAFTNVGGAESDKKTLLRDDIVALDHFSGAIAMGIMVDQLSIEWTQNYNTIDPLELDQAETLPSKNFKHAVDPRIAMMNNELNDPAKYLSNVSSWKNLVMWDGHLKKVIGLSGEIYSSAAFVNYDQIEISATFYDQDNRPLGKEVFKLDITIAAGELAKYNYELKAMYDNMDRIGVEIISAKGKKEKS